MTISIFSYGSSTNNIRKVGDNPIKAMLLVNTYVPNANTHEFRSDVESFEVSASGYTAGGISLVNSSWTYDSVNKWTSLKSDNPLWGVSPVTNVRYVVFYASLGSSTTDVLLSYVDLGQNIDLTSEGLTLTLPTDGIYRLRVSSAGP